jgi:phenylpyruvate tautomerase PptA (4-oxalocrotonate tautomerase family)
MPLVRIDLIKGRSAEFRRGVGEVIYDAMRATLNVPEDDRFEILNEHAAENFVFDPDYLGIRRSDQLVVIQVTLNEGRDVPMKQNFYRAVAEGLQARLGLRMEDVFISLVEVRKENWSFGNGIAQYATA